jgi:hypothetical protein
MMFSLLKSRRPWTSIGKQRVGAMSFLLEESGAGEIYVRD